MLGLLHATTPGSALGGRPNPKLPVQKSTEAEVEGNKLSTKDQEEPVLGHVYLKRNETDVSSIGYFEGDILLNRGEKLETMEVVLIFSTVPWLPPCNTRWSVTLIIFMILRIK